MKTSVLTKSIFGFILLFLCSMQIAAVSPKNYLYDTKEENGKIISKTVFMQENGLLNKQVMYEFVYDENGKVTEKKACRWNKGSNKWEPFYQIMYNYNKENEIIHSTYGMWNKKTNDYSLNVQEMTLPVSSYDEIFS